MSFSSKVEEDLLMEATHRAQVVGTFALHDIMPTAGISPQEGDAENTLLYRRPLSKGKGNENTHRRSSSRHGDRV